ncbi:MAG: hypothetical protein SFX18_18240 [Pirellulales bacterium]|nr:hypothetical protein [Pirellulales bacterium]
MPPVTSKSSITVVSSILCNTFVSLPIRPLFWRVVVGTIVCLALLPGPVQFLAEGSVRADEIFLKIPRSEKDNQGRVKSIGSLKGRVTAENMNANEVTYTFGNNKSDVISTNEILGISFDEEPTEFQAIRDKYTHGDYRSAYGDLQEYIAKNPMPAFRSDLVKQEFDFMAAYLPAMLVIQGSPPDNFPANKAAGDLFRFLNANKNYYQYYQVAEAIGDLSLLTEAPNRLENAYKFYNYLAASPLKEHKIRAELLKARGALRENKFDEAVRLLAPLASQTPDSPALISLLQQAKVAFAVAQAGQGKADDALKQLEKIIADTSASDAETHARANVALGNIYLAKDQKYDALLSFLKVDLVFNQNPDLQAEALEKLSKLWRAVPNAKGDRAAEAKERLQNLYPASRWNKSA